MLKRNYQIYRKEGWGKVKSYLMKSVYYFYREPKPYVHIIIVIIR